MPKMTAEQKQAWTVKFAEAMGWSIVHIGKPPVIWAVRKNEHSDQPVDFWTDANDAIELAEKLFPAWSLHSDFSGAFCLQGQLNPGVPCPVVVTAPALCEAICLAAIALLEAK